MRVALVVVGQERQDVDAQHVRRDQKHGFQVVPDLDVLPDRKNLVKEKCIRLVNKLVVLGVKVKSELVLDLFDLLV